MAYFMTIVDFTIVNVALPTIGAKVHFAESNLQWVVRAYASLGCGLATSDAFLIVMRGIQGFGAAVVLPGDPLESEAARSSRRPIRRLTLHQ